VVVDERRRAEQTPIVPQIYITGRMIERDPDWLWTEHRCALLREAPIFLEEESIDSTDMRSSPRGWAGGPEYDRQLRAITRDLDRVWATLHGARSALHRELMRTLGRFILHPAAAVERKLLSPGRLRDDYRYLGFARHFWHSPDFRRKTLPLLVVPTSRLRMDGANADERSPPSVEDAPDAALTRLKGTPPARLVARRGAWVEVFVHNASDGTLSCLDPHYAATYALWIERATGRRLSEPMYVTPLFPALRPGRERRLEQLLTVPEPGKYDLAIDLFSRRTGRTLSGARPLYGPVEVVAAQPAEG